MGGVGSASLDVRFIDGASVGSLPVPISEASPSLNSDNANSEQDGRFSTKYAVSNSADARFQR